MIGSRIGSYDVVAKLGEGGMGEVYRARDSKLGRDVALKILPETFAGDPERLARFRREAQVLASLSHPNIAAIFGIEDGAPMALVMELIEGRTLAELATTPMSVPDTIAIARQIADALDAAHEAGIIHRDLKPANIQIRTDGTVKVLDFGLAKAGASSAGSAADPANSPTFTGLGTQLGMILGTAAYMAPEQAKGRPVDKRADIWAFGVVLYEMLSGRRAFQGEDASETMAAVLTREPEFGALPASTPAPLIALMRRCLERDPRRRLRDIGEARIALDAPMIDAPPAPGVTAATVASRRATMMWRVVAAGLALALAIVSAGWWRTASTNRGLGARAAILLPGDVTFDLALYPVVEVSPDGATIALVGSSGGVRRLYVRRLSDFEPRLLEGTDDASSPFFSPDGRWLGFFAGGKLKKVSADGGPVIVLADAEENRGGVWTDSDTIIYAPNAASPVFRVAGAGGTPTAISTVEQSKSERTHRWPTVLPDGQTVVFTVGSVEHPDDYDDARIDSVRLDTGERRVVIERGRMARYASTGHLLFLRGKVLYAVRFDPDRGTVGGSEVPVIDGVSGDVTTGAANYAVAESGAIVFVPGDPAGGVRRLAWVDQNGVATPIDATPAFYSDPHVSPDGLRVAIAVMGTGSARDLHVIDIARGTSSRLASGGENRTPFWSMDSRRLIYVTRDRGRNMSVVMTRSADGTGDPEVVGEVAGQAYIDDVTHDGATALLSVDPSTAGARFSIVKLAVRAGAKAVPLLSNAASNVYSPSLSPDDRWLAYVSNETGRAEVYVQSFASGGNRSRVSNAGGAEPRWAVDGRTLYYVQAGTLMSVPVESGVAFSPGRPRALFDGLLPPVTDSGQTFDVAPRGDRFLMLQPVRDGAGTPEVRLILNWFDELRALRTGQ